MVPILLTVQYTFEQHLTTTVGLIPQDMDYIKNFLGYKIDGEGAIENCYPMFLQVTASTSQCCKISTSLVSEDESEHCPGNIEHSYYFSN